MAYSEKAFGKKARDVAPGIGELPLSTSDERKAREREIHAKAMAEQQAASAASARAAGGVNLADGPETGADPQARATAPEAERLSAVARTVQDVQEAEAAGLLPAIPSFRGGGGNKDIQAGVEKRDEAEGDVMAGAEEVADRYDDQAGQREEAYDAIANANEAADMDLDQARAEYDAGIDEMSSEKAAAEEQAGRSIDVDRYEKGLSVAEKTKNIFAQVLSSAGQSMLAVAGNTDSKNLAVEAINAQIDLDIQEQQQDIAAGQRKLEAIGLREGKLWKDLEDQRQRIENTRQMRLQEAGLALDEVAARTKDVVEREAALATKAQLLAGQGERQIKSGQAKNAAAAAARAQAMQARQKFIDERTKENFGQRGKIELEEAKASAKLKAEKEGYSHYVPGVEWVGGVPNSKAIAQVREARVGTESTRSAIARLNGLLNEMSTLDRVSGKFSEKREQAEGLYNQLKAEIARGFGGPITESDLKQAGIMIGTTGGWNPINEMAKLRALETSLVNRYKATVESNGGRLAAGVSGPRSARQRGGK